MFNRELKNTLRDRNKQIAKDKMTIDILLELRKNIKNILSENDYGSVQNLRNKINSAVETCDRQLH